MWSPLNPLFQCENCTLVGEENCFEHGIGKQSSFLVSNSDSADFEFSPASFSSSTGSPFSSTGSPDFSDETLHSSHSAPHSPAQSPFPTFSPNPTAQLHAGPKSEDQVIQEQIDQLTIQLQQIQYQFQASRSADHPSFDLQSKVSQIRSEMTHLVNEIGQRKLAPTISSNELVPHAFQQPMQLALSPQHASNAMDEDAPQASPNSFSIQCVIFDYVLQQEREKTIINTSFAPGFDLTLMSSFKRKPFASSSKWFQNTTDQMSFVCAVSPNLISAHDFKISKLVVLVNGAAVEFAECLLTSKNFKKFFHGANILGFRFYNNTERKGMWKMKESYKIQCRYDNFTSNPIEIIFDKVSTNRNAKVKLVEKSNFEEQESHKRIKISSGIPTKDPLMGMNNMGTNEILYYKNFVSTPDVSSMFTTNEKFTSPVVYSDSSVVRNVVDNMLFSRVIPDYNAVVSSPEISVKGNEETIINLIIMHSMFDREVLKHCEKVKNFVTTFLVRNQGYGEIRGWFFETFFDEKEMKLQAVEEYEKLQTPLAYTLLTLLNYQLYPSLETERQLFALFETVDIMKIYGSFTMEFRNLKASEFINFLRHHKQYKAYEGFPLQVYLAWGFHININPPFNTFQNKVMMLQQRFYRFQVSKLHWQNCMQMFTMLSDDERAFYYDNYYVHSFHKLLPYTTRESIRVLAEYLIRLRPDITVLFWEVEKHKEKMVQQMLQDQRQPMSCPFENSISVHVSS